MSRFLFFRHRRFVFGLAMLVGTAVALLALLTLFGTAWAGGSCNVSSGGSIQAAINNLSCPVITVGAGTYTENLSVTRSVTITGAGSSTVIDGSGSDRVITIDGSGIIVSLQDLRVTNGNATAASVSGRNGGGILVTNNATLHATNLQIDNNIASTAAQTGFGGGIAINAGTAYITDTLVTGNYAGRRASTFTSLGEGGGLYVNGASYLSLYSSHIMTNTAAYRAGGTFAAGGGLFQNNAGGTSTVVSRNNVWQGNVARDSNSSSCSGCNAADPSGDGGAIAVVIAGANAVLTVDGDSFYNNIANASNDDYGASEKAGGGAISLLATNTNGAIDATIRRATFRGNVAKAGSGTGEGRGGAVHARLANLTVEQSILLDNISAAVGEGNGGGIYIREPNVDDALVVSNSILAGNEANGIGNGAQIFADYTTANSNDLTLQHVTLADDTLNTFEALHANMPTAGDFLTIENSIFANHAVGIHNVNATGFLSGTYLLFYNNTQNQLSPGSTAFPNNSTWVAGNPLFVDAANGDYHIGPGSAAFDAGGASSVMVDIDGDGRPQFDAPDIGADELVRLLYLPFIVK